MNRAFEDVFGVPGALAGIQMAGRTDASILADAFDRHRVTAGAAGIAALRARYLVCLREEMSRSGTAGRILPGITPLVGALAGRADLLLGLLTGNFADAAEVKLSHFDLWRHFRCGAFGDDAPDRNHLVPVAIDRARRHGLAAHLEPDRVVVVGDTPRDVACARAHLARVVAVATGEYTADQLRSAGAEVVFRDFSDVAAVLDAIAGSDGSPT